MTERYDGPTGEPTDESTDDSTGNAQVDQVLATLEQLDSAPVDEHVAVFESAHEQLRGALADAGDDPGPDMVMTWA